MRKFLSCLTALLLALGTQWIVSLRQRNIADKCDGKGRRNRLYADH